MVSPRAYQALAVSGVLALFGGPVGPATAPGPTQDPAQRILRITSNSEHVVTLNGRVFSLQGSTLTLQPGPGVPFDSRNSTITAATKLLRDRQRITSADLRVGDDVEIQAVVRGQSVEAIRIHARSALPVAASTDVGLSRRVSLEQQERRPAPPLSCLRPSW